MSNKLRLIITSVLLLSAVSFALLGFEFKFPAPAMTLNDNRGKIAPDRLPLSMIENVGQVDEEIAWYTHGSRQSLYFTRDGYKLRMTNGNMEKPVSHTLTVELVDAQTKRIEGLQQASNVVSYFKGSPEHWKAGIPTHSKIGYVAPWPGIDLAYDGTEGSLQSFFTVKPYSDPRQIKLRYSGHDSLHIDDGGELVRSTPLGNVSETAPIAWQDIDGERRPVETEFTLLDDHTVGFRLAEYDVAHSLTIDPTLIYGSYFGGSGLDTGQAVAVDSSGNIYVTGSTFAASPDDFPRTSMVFDDTHNGSSDVYVAKFNSSGTTLLYSGYIGGSGNDSVMDIAVDSSGNAYIAGVTSSTDFPTAGLLDTSYNGGPDDAFVAKITASGGGLSYSGYIGGSRSDDATGIAVDSQGNAYVVGGTLSSETMSFPVSGGPGGPDMSFNSSTNCNPAAGECHPDAFIAKVNPSGSSLLFAGYIGGTSTDRATGVAVDGSGNAYVSGNTNSNTSFPVMTGPDLTSNPSDDGFVAKVDSSTGSLVYCGFIGGNATDNAFNIAVDSAGSAYVTGRAGSPETAGFPVVIGPDLTHNNPGSFDAFIVKVNPQGTGFEYAGFIGGSSAAEYGRNVAVDSSGNAYVVGSTVSTEATFPVRIGPDLTYNGSTTGQAGDAFIAKVTQLGSKLVYAGYIGGSNDEIAHGVAVNSSGNAIVVGNTDSGPSSFPDGDGFGSILGFNQTAVGGTGDAFLTILAPGPEHAAFDFDYDGKADQSVFRPVNPPQNSIWYYLSSSSGSTIGFEWGFSTDVLVPADYDGDGKADYAIFRDGAWAIWQSTSSSGRYETFGQSGDIPRPGDFDGDGEADLGVFRPSDGTWYFKRSSDSTQGGTQFGSSGDHPMLGDYNADGRTDFALFRPSNSTWYIRRILSTGTNIDTTDQFGSSGDIPVNGDFTGDIKSDLAVFRPSNGTWYVATGTPAAQVFVATQFGQSGDIPVPANYDGDIKTDIAVFRPGTTNATWYVLSSLTGQTITTQFGLTADKPIPAAYQP